MDIPRHWRLKDQRYRLIGEICPRCNAKIFPPRDICPECDDTGKRRLEVKEIKAVLAHGKEKC